MDIVQHNCYMLEVSLLKCRYYLAFDLAFLDLSNQNQTCLSIFLVLCLLSFTFKINFTGIKKHSCFQCGFLIPVYFFFFFFLYFFFHLPCVAVPGPGMESELELRPTPQLQQHTRFGSGIELVPPQGRAGSLIHCTRAGTPFFYFSFLKMLLKYS